jgi:hypothetical protein
VHVPEEVLPQPVGERGADHGECKGYPGTHREADRRRCRAKSADRPLQDRAHRPR